MNKELKADWKLMIKVPDLISSVAFLTDESFLGEYNTLVDKDFGGNSRLKVFRYSDGIVKGSNPFAVSLVNSMISQIGYRVATQAQLERILDSGTLELRGTYEDSGLVLRSEGDPNEYLARNLAKQVKARGMKIRNPIVISLSDLEVVNDSSSEYGLAFNINDGANLIEAPSLCFDGFFDSEDIDSETGLPKKSDVGRRTLYTRNSGLSRLFLGRYLGLNSGDQYLTYSYDYGRVVLVRDEVAGADFARYAAELESEFQRQQSELLEKREQAFRVLRGNR